MSSTIELAEAGVVLTYSFDDLTKFHGTGSPAGVAIAFKVLERALPALARSGPCERREIRIDTAFGGPGARDAFEMATRAVSDGRFTVDASLRRPERGPAAERFVFRIAYRSDSIGLFLRPGIVSDDFAGLAFAATRTPDEEARLTVLKRELAERVLAVAATDLFDLGG